MATAKLQVLYGGNGWRAIVDHVHSDTVLRELEVMRSSGTFVTTSSEARVRADVLLLIAPGFGDAWLELLD